MSIQNPKKKKPYANRTQGYEMTINDNKEDLDDKVVVCHKSASDGTTLTTMCGKDEES